MAREIWVGLGGEPTATEGIHFHGTGDLRSPFPVVDLAAATFGAAGLAVSELLDTAGLGATEVSVDRRNATAWFDIPFAPTRFIDNPPRHGIHEKWMAEFQTADDRWVRVQAIYPTLRRRLFEALNIRDDETAADRVAAAMRSLPGEEAERLLVERGAAAALARSLEEWRAHPQGAAVACEPIGVISETNETGRRWMPTPGRPLSGLRVLESTRVVAGPMGARFLAALGAEVLRIDAPSSDEVAIGSANDINLGKRWALLDIQTEDGKARFRELLASADVFIHGHRPDALERLGLGDEERASISPGLVDVALNAYGWTGPWQGRRGFDTLVQYASGIAHGVSRWANEDPNARLPLNSLGRIVDASRPRHLSVEALDFSTGYQVAAAAIRGITRRLATGRGSTTKLSLARTCALLTGVDFTPSAEEFTLPYDVPVVDQRIYDLGGRPSRRVPFPVNIAGNPLYWERPAEEPGSSAPQWAVKRRADDH